MWAQAVDFIKQVGFPIFVTMWFLLRLEKRLDRAMEMMQRLLLSFEILAKSMDDQGGRRQRRMSVPSAPALPDKEDET